MEALIWLMINLAAFALCLFLPLKIKNDKVRSFVMRWVLVPVSLLILLYVYPFGIELFRRLAVSQ